MKLKLFVATVAAALALTSTCFAQDINVSLNGNVVNFPNQKPVVVDGRTLIPLRGVFDNMGYAIDWNGNTKTVTLTKGSDTIVITIGENQYYHNNQAVSLDVPAQIINGSTMLPLRAIGDATGAEILWDADTKLATIVDSTLADTSAPQATVIATSQQEADYITSYTEIMKEYNESVSSLLSVVSELSSVSNPSAELVNSMIAGAKATNSAATSAKQKVSALSCPAKYQALNNATIEYMQATISFTDVLSKADKLSESEFESGIQSELSNLLLKEAAYGEAFTEATK
jgi:hypothetical protein